MSPAPGSGHDVESSWLAGRYELGASLGRGGMAEVRRATDHTLRREVAVKLLSETAGDAADRRRFVDEARTLAALSHSGLVTVLDAGFGTGSTHRSAGEEDRPYLVMELVEGHTLADRISESVLEPEDAGAVGVQVAEALSYVHGRGVVHRDVKPANVLLGPAGRVKLADFGIARLLGETARHTRTGQTIGTAAYLAPEQVTGREVAGAADVYSLGLVLLECLTGRREYPGPATEAALARLHRDPDVPERLPRRWRELLVSMTRADPAARPSAAEVAEILRGQPTGPIPVPHEGRPDAVTVPLLAGEPSAARTRILADAVTPGRHATVPEPVPPSPTLPPAPATRAPAPAAMADRLGDALARGVGDGWRRVQRRARSSSSYERGAALSIAALILFLVVVSVVAATSDRSSGDLPSRTPAEMEQPLRDLHIAINGEDG